MFLPMNLRFLLLFFLNSEVYRLIKQIYFPVAIDFALFFFLNRATC